MRRAFSLIGSFAVLSACAEVGSEAPRTGTTSQWATVCAAGPTVPGIDVSKYQGNVDWAAVKAAGIEFAFVRVSDGINFPDGKFAQNWAGTRDSGILRGAYQFFRPGQDAIAQADILLEAIDYTADGDIPPVLDLETADGHSITTVINGAKAWLDHVEEATGVRPIVYTGAYFWNGTMDNHPALADYPLWIPQYGPACPNVPAPWTDWAFFQYTDSGTVPGITGPVDRNDFNGSRDDLLALVTGAEPASCDPLGAQGGVIDDDSGCFEAGGKSQYIRHEAAGHGGGLKWTYATDLDTVENYGIWSIELEHAGRYHVEVYTQAPHAQSRQARYQIAHGASFTDVVLDQGLTSGWRSLGELDFEAGGAQWIRLDDNTGEANADARKLAFDAVRLTPVATGDDGDDPSDDPEEGETPAPADAPAQIAGGCQAAGHGSSATWLLVLGAFAFLHRRRA